MPASSTSSTDGFHPIAGSVLIIVSLHSFIRMALSRARAVRVSMNHLPRPASHHFASISAYVPVCACAWFVCVDVCVRVDVRACVLSHSELCHWIRLHPKSRNIELPAGPFNRGSPRESENRTPGCAALSEVNSGVRTSRSLLCNSTGNDPSESRTPQLCHSVENHPRTPLIAFPAMSFDRMSPQ